jgi:hypothetical protein
MRREGNDITWWKAQTEWEMRRDQVFPKGLVEHPFFANLKRVEDLVYLPHKSYHIKYSKGNDICSEYTGLIENTIQYLETQR